MTDGRFSLITTFVVDSPATTIIVVTSSLFIVMRPWSAVVSTQAPQRVKHRVHLVDTVDRHARNAQVPGQVSRFMSIRIGDRNGLRQVSVTLTALIVFQQIIALILQGLDQKLTGVEASRVVREILS